MATPSHGSQHNGGNIMANHVYKKIELVGTSEVSVEDAVSTAIERSSRTIRNLRWFEVTQVRGDIVNGKVSYFQVTMNVGFTLDEG
ncbi:MAG TPA: dodecin [Acidocella sp.]|nr:dodecin [Acidocella sp.]